MGRIGGTTLRAAVGLALVTIWTGAEATAQQGAADGEWRSYAGDTGSTKYAPLDQIDAGNVRELRIAWRWRSIDYERRAADPELRFNDTFLVTPLMAGGRLFVSTNLGGAAAIDAASGETVWAYHGLDDGAGRAAGGGTRGVGYWHDAARGDERVFLVSGEQLVALDADTGQPIGEFGEGGKVNLRAGVPRLEEYRWTAAPLVCRDTVIVGMRVGDQPLFKEAPPGYVRGFDADTGRLRWQFNPVPQAGEFGHETWGGEAALYSGAANVWTVMSADEELGYAYLPTGTPTNDWYGGRRPGEGSSAFLAMPPLGGGRMFRAFDKTTGAVAWQTELPAGTSGAPMTYLAGGRQYVVVAVSDRGHEGELVAFALP